VSPPLAALREVHPALVLYYAVATLVALVVHEFAHAAAASALGDHTPRAMGRLSVDPRRHADPFGTFVLPAILLLILFFVGSQWVVFAYAKPMPLNPWNTGRRTRDTLLIQAAGPAANLALAFAFAALVSTACHSHQAAAFLGACVAANATFAAIHLIPIPPLDAARAIVPFLSYRARDFFVNLEQYAPVIMLLVFFILGGFFGSLVITMRDAIVNTLPGC
jgi:Zn-dependent protease